MQSIHTFLNNEASLSPLSRALLKPFKPQCQCMVSCNISHVLVIFDEEVLLLIPLFQQSCVPNTWFGQNTTFSLPKEGLLVIKTPAIRAFLTPFHSGILVRTFKFATQKEERKGG